MAKRTDRVCFPTVSSETDTLWLEGQTSQGYERKVYKKKDGSVVIIKKIPEDDHTYIASLLPNTTIVSPEIDGDKFIESFKKQRLAIIDFEGLFFYHYAQVTSSIKACYQQEAAKQIANLSDPKKVQNTDQIDAKKAKIDAHLKQELSSIDALFKNFIDSKKDDINTIFKQAIETNINQDGTIDVSSLNTQLNKEIKPLKNSLDELLKDRLEEAGIIISPGKFRKTTNAFGENTIDITETPGEDGKTFIEKIESTKITAHDKKNGPAVSKVSMIVKKIQTDGSVEEKTIFEGYRTSHLVSNPVSWKDARYAKAMVVVAGVLGGLILAGTFVFPPLGFALIGIAAGLILKIKYDKDKKEQDNINNTKDIIQQFMVNARQQQAEPLIYNLYASTHDAYSNISLSPTTFLKNFVSGIADDKDNQQTQRLKTLIDAQYEFNKEKDDIGQMFFTLNTPTNTFGREISLKAFPQIIYPKMHQVAQSNLIALAILLYGKDNKELQTLVTAYKDKNSSAFNKAYEILKQTTPDFSEENPQINKAQKFLYERFKEDSAAEHQHAKTSATCIGILAHAKANLIAGCKSGNERTGGILGRIATFLTSTVELNELDSLYNKTRCNGAAVTAVSRIDQGSDPKTGTKTGGFLDQFNTNKTEAQDMVNIQTDSVSGLQAHKEKNKTFKAVDTSAFEKMYQKLLGSSEQIPEEIAAYFSYEDPKGAIYNSVNSTKLSLPSVEKGNVSDKRARRAFLSFIKDYEQSVEQIPVFENFSMEDFSFIQRSKDETLTTKLDKINANTLKTTCFNPIEVQKITQFLQENKKSSLLDKLVTKKIHTMESLFGKEGLKLFKEALQEEVNSQEFLEALVKHAVKPYYGTKPPGEFLFQILSGASGAGKSTSGNQALEREYQTPTPKPADPTYWMGWVDGGIPRELNQMQQVIKSFCIEHGVEVEDLYDHSKKILDPCKDKILELVIAQNDPNLGLVIPETFSKDAFFEVFSAKTDAKKRIKQIKDLETSLKTNKENTVKVSYDFVVGLNLRRHASVVEYMGDRRAFDDPESTAIKYDKFHELFEGTDEASRLNKYKTKEAFTGGFAEYKKYGPDGYIWGIKGSLAGFLQFNKAFQSKQMSMNFNCNDVDIYTSEGYLWNFNADNSGKEAIIASRRLVDDWLKEPPDSNGLKQYAAEHWKKYQNIMIPFEPGALKYAIAPDLEKIILANIGKKASLLKSEHNLEYLIKLLKILNDLQKNGNKVNFVAETPIIY
ncbi:MAG: hypothetical protein EBY16_04075 [Gammaproteobacteria bacterium]|nr:hypothetical protein [Gammaproteobacteria bacterium]